MGHRKGMSKRGGRMLTKRQKHRYMDYEKLDMQNNDLRYTRPDIMGIVNAKVTQKEHQKLIRRMKKA